MVTATARNIRALLDGKPATHEATWNAVCLADFGDRGVAFVAMPEIPPRNVNWSSQGKWVHTAKVAFEKYFLRKIRRGGQRAVLREVRAAPHGCREARERASAAITPSRPTINARSYPMSIDRIVIAFAGSVVLLSLLLSQLHSPAWLWLTAFVGANLLQSAFTGFCPLAKILKGLGLRTGEAYR